MSTYLPINYTTIAIVAFCDAIPEHTVIYQLVFISPSNSATTKAPSLPFYTIDSL